MSLNLTGYFKKLGGTLVLMAMGLMLLAGTVVATAGVAGWGAHSDNRTTILAGPEDAARAMAQSVQPASASHSRVQAPSRDAAGLPYIELRDLPREALDTLRLIKRSGPYPYQRDGVVFGNFERKLPRQKRGYYTEYTVRTPGVRTRGARRIIAGKGRTGNPATSCEYYYTADHYQSFSRIREESCR